MPGDEVVVTERIVVGIDDHDASERAVAWVAARRVVPGSTVELISVGNSWGHDVRRVERRLARAADGLHAAHPAADVSTTTLFGPPDRILVEAASTADLLVIGSRRQHRVRTALDGWMPERVPTLAAVPTVIVPEDWRATQGPVLLGVDDETGGTALRFAGAQAVREHRSLTLVRAWETPTPSLVGALIALDDPGLLEAHARTVLVDAERVLHMRFPGVRPDPVLEEGAPADVLQRHARGASLVVLGRHHRSTLGGLVSGSTAHELITRSGTPICVAPLAMVGVARR